LIDAYGLLSHMDLYVRCSSFLVIGKEASQG